MRVYKELSPLDKLNKSEAIEANKNLALVALALALVFISYVIGA